MKSYNALKSNTEDALVYRLMAAGLKRGVFAERRISLAFIWHEADRKRDPDNVRTGAKLILDALARRGRFIHCDGAHCIKGFDGDGFVYDGEHGYRAPGVDVIIRLWTRPPRLPGQVQESSELDVAGFQLWLPGRLPDYNELSKAREIGTRRAVYRSAQEKRLGNG